MHTPVFDPWQTAWVYADAVGAPRASAALWQAQRTRRLAALLSAAQRSRLYRERLAGAASSGDPWQIHSPASRMVGPCASSRTYRKLAGVSRRSVHDAASRAVALKS